MKNTATVTYSQETHNCHNYSYATFSKGQSDYTIHISSWGHDEGCVNYHSKRRNISGMGTLKRYTDGAFLLKFPQYETILKTIKANMPTGNKAPSNNRIPKATK